MPGVGRAILAGGLIAGTVDIGAASLIFHARPLVILCNIAGGLVGPAAARAGGLQTALLGLLLQWGMSLLIAAIYCLVALYLLWLLARPVLWGLAYGIAIFAVMNYVVVPLSAISRVPHFSPSMFALNLAAMLLFGLIISLAAHRFMRLAASRS